MTDLLRVLPNFPAAQFSKILHACDTHNVTTADLLTLDASDLASRAKLPLLDLKRFAAAVLNALHRDLSVLPSRDPSGKGAARPAKKSLSELRDSWSAISTLDPALDEALGGGIPAGYVTEITGESGTGKTQFLLSLLLAVQLPPPYGLSRPALYISTEAPLSTRRLAQMLASHPLLKDPPDGSPRPSLDDIVSTMTPDLESQDHILQFQVPVEVQRRNVGLVVLDSVAANYRAEFERGTSAGRTSNMGMRGNELVRLGAHLRDLARKYNLAVVVSNQVADRFSSAAASASIARIVVSSSSIGPPTQESPLAARSRRVLPSAHDDEDPELTQGGYVPPPMPGTQVDEAAPAALLLDHQQRWFTGWGDDPFADYVLKTPSLGLVWSTQIACRIALFRRPVYGRRGEGEDGGVQRVAAEEDGESLVPTQTGWERWMKVVFAPHAPESGKGLEGAVRFDVTMAGLKAAKDS